MLTIHNTLTRQKETFKPITPGHIKLYVCGITVYDYCHLGHARVFVAFDAIVRFLRATGWKVTYVRNITDIDDKIIKRAEENQESMSSLTARFIDAMHEDEARLGILKPDEEPRATEAIDSMLEICKTLEEKGLAYLGDSGDLYFDVKAFPTYGALSHRDLDSLQAGSRVDVVEAKKSPLDFVLWKKAKAGEPSWPSPWGEGRPGWHIECSAMSTDCLGKHFDLHGGGHDLTFPHHENERAQSEGAFDCTFVNTWMHVGFVQVDKEKMSKSLNNFFTIRDILKDHSGEVVRFFLLSSHYRSPVNYSADLDNAKNALTTLYTALRGLEIGHVDTTSTEFQTFIDYMNDDFNTPKAISVLFDLAHEINSLRQAGQDAAQKAGLLKHLAQMLGLLTQDPDQYFQGDNLDDTIEKLIKEREDARSHKNWARSDEIRKHLLDQGIVLDDTPQGTVWRRQS